jgi:hypothetical protein
MVHGAPHLDACAACAAAAPTRTRHFIRVQCTVLVNGVDVMTLSEASDDAMEEDLEDQEFKDILLRLGAVPNADASPAWERDDMQETQFDASSWLTNADLADVFRGDDQHLVRLQLMMHVHSVEYEPPTGARVGSGGSECDGCGNSLDRLRRLHETLGEQLIDGALKVCTRCQYAVCGECVVHHSRGTCYCKDSNFNFLYPLDNQERAWYHHGLW